jgi:23S rRNA (cytidine1920-2'-O)/16S rRNA (cytidine1409-2'-O)-methyltransferase
MLQRKGLVDSRESAQRLILAGKVLAAGLPVRKASQMIDADDDLTITESPKYASRGGLKLERALDTFSIDVSGKVVIDVGASTGGFTDVLLQQGASRIYAIDVGYGQFAWKLRQDSRVVLMERTNARHLTRDLFAEAIDMAVIDVSFIGAQKILEPLLAITQEIVLLLKPQFEAGPADVPRGGVIRKAEVHRKVLLDFYQHLSGWHVHGLIESPVLGGDGNREFLLHLFTRSGWSEETYRQRVEELTT